MSRRIFISSKVLGLEPFRRAAQLAVQSLHFEPLMAESQPAHSSAPQAICLDFVRRADVIVLLLGKEYGQPQGAGLSATEEEFHEAVRLRKPVFAFAVANHFDARQTEFVSHVRSWEGGRFGPECFFPELLQMEVVRALHQLDSGVPDPEVQRRVTTALRGVLPDPRRDSISTSRPWFAMAWCPRAPAERVDSHEFFGGFREELADWFVAGPARILMTRPHVAAMENHLELSVARTANREPGFRAVASPDGLLAIGQEMSRMSEEGLNSLVSGMFHASPRQAVGMLRSMLALGALYMNRMDPGMLSPQGYLQVGLTNLGMAHFAEEPLRTAHGGIPMRMIDADGPFLAPAEPQLLGRGDLQRDSAQAQTLVDRLARRIHPGGLEQHSSTQ